ncbi:hypothetical protein JCM9534A_17550 [Catenuloplanes indicus JCM 9534]
MRRRARSGGILGDRLVVFARAVAMQVIHGVAEDASVRMDRPSRAACADTIGASPRLDAGQA